MRDWRLAALAGRAGYSLLKGDNSPRIWRWRTVVPHEHPLFPDNSRIKARCDPGIYPGAAATNARSVAALAPRTAGLKFYLDATFGPLRLEGLAPALAHAARWPPADTLEKLPAGAQLVQSAPA